MAATWRLLDAFSLDDLPSFSRTVLTSSPVLVLPRREGAPLQAGSSFRASFYSHSNAAAPVHLVRSAERAQLRQPTELSMSGVDETELPEPLQTLMRLHKRTMLDLFKEWEAAGDGVSAATFADGVYAVSGTRLSEDDLLTTLQCVDPVRGDEVLLGEQWKARKLDCKRLRRKLQNCESRAASRYIRESCGKSPEKKKMGARLRKISADDGAPPLDQLKAILRSEHGRVMDVFRAWDTDGNQQISKREFFRALPVLGVLVERADADAIFDSFDADGSGQLDYTELHKQLRAGADVGLDAALRDGAAGTIETRASNRIALRDGLDASKNTMFGSITLDASLPILEQLKKALAAPTVLSRVIDIFRAWDEDNSGTVSKREFVQALPMLGLEVERAHADDLFDSIDTDGSGTIEYSEMHRKLRRTMAAQALLSSKIPSPPKRKSEASSFKAMVEQKEAARAVASHHAQIQFNFESVDAQDPE